MSGKIILLVTVFAVILNLSVGNFHFIQNQNKNCATAYIGYCDDNNYTISEKCQRIRKGRLDRWAQIVIPSGKVPETDLLNVTYLNIPLPRHIIELVTVEINAGCRLTICDGENLMGLHCHQFLPGRSYNLTLPSDQSGVSVQISNAWIRSAMCVCENENIPNQSNEERRNLWRSILPEGHFERNYMGVMFSEYVNGLDNLEDVRKSLLKIVTRFTNIAAYSSTNNNSSFELIMRAAAEINEQFGYLVFRVNVVIDQNQVNNTLTVIQKSNQIFPGTVWGITAQMNEKISVDQVQQIKNETERRGVKDDIFNQIKIGIQIPVYNYSKISVEIANIVDYVILRHLNISIENNIEELQKDFLLKKQELQTKNSKLKVYIEWGLSSKGEGEKKSVKKLHEFWNKMGEFATNNRLHLFMLEATDQHGEVGERAHYGWWMRDDLTGELVEKEEEEEPPVESTGVGARKGGTEWGIILGGTLAMVMLIFGVTSGVLWRRLGTAKSHRDDLKHLAKNFLKGSPNATPNEEERHYVVALRAPYDPKDELSLKDITTDESSVKVSREYVTVVRGRINNGHFNCDIILKRTSSQSSLTSIKHLLTEIKIYNYLGVHPNVVRFLGAITSKIEQGVVQLALEFCPLGDLQSFLRKRVDPSILNEMLQCGEENVEPGASSTRVVYVSLGETVDNSDSGYVTSFEDTDDNSKNDVTECLFAIDIFQMYLWCSQIASVMEFLETRQIVHADLAARNCLLYTENLIKVSDFGLSKRQYVEMGQVVHDEDTPVPFRWMAPESLKKLVFSPKSDVWSFGVTVWEIFSLAQLPFQGVECDVRFVEQMENGSLRLTRPKYASSEVYDALLRCWNSCPDQRPSFTELEQFFRNFLTDETVSICTDETRM